MMHHLEPSDIMLLIDFGLALFLALYFALGYPRTWWRDRLGWVIFGYAVTTVSFIGLIAYAILFEQKVIEPIRFLVGLAMAGALAWKTWAVYRERREARRTHRAHHDEENPMSIPTSDAVKAATDIWYKGKRVLRTIVQTAIPAFLSFALVLPAIIEALGLPADAELRLWLLAVAAGVTAVAGAISRVMAIPAVNAWLIKIGLGSVPQEAVRVSTSPHVVGKSVTVEPDPKALNDGR